MPNLLNKNRNLREEIDELQIVCGEAEHRQRIRQVVGERTEGQPEESPSVVVVAGYTGTNEGCHNSPKRRGRSNEELLEETRHRLAVLEETKEQFLHSSHTPLREGAYEEGEEARPTEDTGARGSVRAALHDGQSNPPRPTLNSSATRSSGSGNQQARSTMSKKRKLPKFTCDKKEDLVRHCRTCEMIWTANSVTDANEWLNQFPANLRGVAMDWFSDMDKAKISTWDNLKEFQAEFQLLRDDNEIVAEIYNCKQGKKDTVRAYNQRLKDLMSRMGTQSADELKKRWCVEGLLGALRRKMKIVPPTSYTDAYDRALNLESESKTAKKKNKKRSKSSSSSKSDESSDEESSADSEEEPSKKVQALQKDLERMRKEFKSMMGTGGHMEEGEIWCTDCKERGHSKGACLKKAMCDISQVLGHSTKECPFNMRTRSQQILFTQEQPSTSGTNNETQGNTNATSGGYRNNC